MDQPTYWAQVQVHLPQLRERSRVLHYYILQNTRMGEVYSSEDLLHETLLKGGRLCHHIRYTPGEEDTAENPNGVLRLLSTAMRNICYSIMSKRENKLMFTVSDELGDGSSTGGARAGKGYSSKYEKAMEDKTSMSPLEVLEWQDNRHNMLEAIDLMANKYPERAAVLLYSLDVQEECQPGDNHRSKAAELGISETSYKQHKFQGIKHLRRVLNP